MMNRQELEKLFKARGYRDFRWIDPKTIVVGHWVRMKCLFGCVDYGKCAACPPEVPPVEDCERFFREYKTVAVFHFEKAVEKPEDRHAWTKPINEKLLDLERELFLAGHYKAFLLPMDSCALCEPCTGRRAACKEPKRARPTPDAWPWTSTPRSVRSATRSRSWPIISRL